MIAKLIFSMAAPVFLCLAAQQSAGAQDAAFDRRLNAVLRASKKSFETLEGARVENRRREFYFEAKDRLPGATYCRIFQLAGVAVYNCEWELAPGKSLAGIYNLDRRY